MDTAVVSNIEMLRKKMLSDKEIIKVTDCGSGHHRSEMRKISSIVKHSSVPAKYGKLLASLAREFGGSDIIELGTSFGISTLYLSYGAISGRIHTIEGCPSVSSIAGENFKRAGRENIISYTGEFDNILWELKKKNIKPGLVFIDGDHRKESVLRYFNLIASMCDDRSVVVIDDINYSQEMSDAWKEIKQSESVSITIDIFRMGLVFFRKGIAKFDYVIR
ncbi:MAG: O-methyltransferase, partial [Bacteroidales bacterium]